MAIQLPDRYVGGPLADQLKPDDPRFPLLLKQRLDGIQQNFEAVSEIDISGTGGGEPGPPGPQGAPGPSGPPGTAGESWFTGTGAPAGGTGIVGDWYLDAAGGDYYEKTGTTTWTLRGNLRGAQGPQGPPGTDSVGGAGAPVVSALIGDGSSTSFTVSHDFGSRDVQVSVYRAVAPFDEVVADVERTDVDTVTVLTQMVPAANEYRVVIAGTSLTGYDKNYVHTQGSPSATWTVTHSLGKYPAVDVVDTGDSVVIPNVHYLNANTVELSFGSATSGQAFIN